MKIWWEKCLSKVIKYNHRIRKSENSLKKLILLKNFASGAVFLLFFLLTRNNKIPLKSQEILLKLVNENQGI